MTRLHGLIFALGLVAVAVVHGAESRVYTDLDEAKAVAAKDGKQVVVEFSGTTWCRYCQLLANEVLPTPEFAEFTKDRVVVLLDYPRKSERTPEKIAADPALAKLMALRDTFKVEGFPTVVLLDASGTEIGRVLGYDPGAGPKAFLAELTSGKNDAAAQ